VPEGEGVFLRENAKMSESAKDRSTAEDAEERRKDKDCASEQAPDHCIDDCRL